jgi:hypothetical protein
MQPQGAAETSSGRLSVQVLNQEQVYFAFYLP